MLTAWHDVRIKLVFERRFIESICWVSPLKSNRVKCLIFVDWSAAEKPNPAVAGQIGLNPTYQVPNFSFRY